MRQFITQYSGLKREVYVLFVGKMVTAMGSFVWPMLTFFFTTKLHLSDGTATMLIATATLLFLPAALFGGRLADRFSRKGIIITFDCLTVGLYLLAAALPLNMGTAASSSLRGCFRPWRLPPTMPSTQIIPPPRSGRRHIHCLIWDLTWAILWVPA